MKDQSKSACLLRIRSVFHNLTKAEQKSAQFILDHPADIIHMTITELAETIETAESTIFRLCKKVGFSGYQQFKIALASDLYTPFESLVNEVELSDSVLEIAGKVFQQIAEGLQDTLKLMEEPAMSKAIAALAQARRIDAYGCGGSAVIAADIEHRFMRFGGAVRAYADPHMQLASASLLQAGDVVLAISHSGSNQDILSAAACAKESGATIIALTSHMRSPLSLLAHISLYGMSREVKYRSEAMSSRLIHLAIIDVLYVGVMLLQQDTITDNMEKVRKAIAMRRL
ncbi:MAG: MurR/RpiR family transcriptional regulator [Sporomusaceae bacterium]|nr:MurR/RpiR family transcriptional regulator [Sporomusaceae bacterium]